jgi:copper chaperone CopZ
MKNILLALLMVSTLGVFAKNITKTIIVKGECGECKDKIEAALDKPGISFAEWNKETKVLTVRYNDNKVSEDDIHQTISDLGYATDKLAANKNSQAALAKCCQPKDLKACGAKAAGCCSKKK